MKTVFYTVQPNDSPPRIAEKILGAGMAYRWPDLIAANPQKLMRGPTFANLTIGERIRVPFTWLPASYAYAASSPGGGCASRAVAGLGDPRPGIPPPGPELPIPLPMPGFPVILAPRGLPVVQVPGGAVLPFNPPAPRPPGTAPLPVGGTAPPVGGTATAAPTTSATPWIIAGLIALAAVGIYVYETKHTGTTRSRRRN